MAPPDQEGFDPGAQSGTAAPYAAPAPGGLALAPYAGCLYDLRGTWWNDGRQTTGGYRPYSAYVYVRQYRSWIHAQQDDGTGYYGQCLGNRLNFDVYNGYAYIGRQYGTVTGGIRPLPLPLYGDSMEPYAAPAVPPIPIADTLRASFTWTTWYASGTEIWQRTYGGAGLIYPIIPPGLTTAPTSTPAPASTLVPTSTPVATPTLAPTPTATPISVAPVVPQPSVLWLHALSATQAYSVTMDPRWVAQPGEWYFVVREQDGWALAIWEHDPPDWQVWIQIDDRVEMRRTR